MLKNVKLMIGTNIQNGHDLLNREYPDLSWWSDNMETLAHYYEGAAIEMTVRLDPKKSMEYVNCEETLDYLNVPIDKYTYGFAEMRCPEGATWYSFGREYLEKNIISINEIFPDLSEFNEEGSGIKMFTWQTKLGVLLYIISMTLNLIYQISVKHKSLEEANLYLQMSIFVLIGLIVLNS